MKNRTFGRVAVVLMVALAVALAALNVWFRWATTRRIQERWGADAMERVARAPQAKWCDVVAVERARLPNDREWLDIDGKSWEMQHCRDLVQTRGFTHLRHALGQNGSYDWDEAVQKTDAWRWAIEFVAADGRTIMLLSEDFRRGRTLDAASHVTFTEKMAAGLKTFFAEQSAAQPEHLPKDGARPDNASESLRKGS